jgi:hypothetical protein
MGTRAIGKKSLLRKALQDRIKFSDLDRKIPALTPRAAALVFAAHRPGRRVLAERTNCPFMTIVEKTAGPFGGAPTARHCTDGGVDVGAISANLLSQHSGMVAIALPSQLI